MMKNSDKIERNSRDVTDGKIRTQLQGYIKEDNKAIQLFEEYIMIKFLDTEKINEKGGYHLSQKLSEIEENLNPSSNKEETSYEMNE
jgi:hypothetical protein